MALTAQHAVLFLCGGRRFAFPPYVNASYAKVIVLGNAWNIH